MKKVLIILIIGGFWSCSSHKKMSEYSKINQETFLNSPFEFNGSIESFVDNQRVNFKVTKILSQNRHYPERTDTIFKLHYKKSEILFYKSHLGKEFLLGGDIHNKRITLSNNIHVGMHQEDFEARFVQQLEKNSNKIEIKDLGSEFTFILKDGKLDQIEFTNYFD